MGRRFDSFGMLPHIQEDLVANIIVEGIYFIIRVPDIIGQVRIPVHQRLETSAQHNRTGFGH